MIKNLNLYLSLPMVMLLDLNIKQANNNNEFMKSKDFKKLSQLTESTNPPAVNFHLNSTIEEGIINGHRIKNFYKIKHDSRYQNKMEIKGPMSAKQNIQNQYFNFVYSERQINNIKNKTQEVTIPKKLSDHSIQNVSKIKPKKPKRQVLFNFKHKQQKPQTKFKKYKTNTCSQKDKNKQKEKEIPKIKEDNISSRQLIMSSMDGKIINDFLYPAYKQVQKLRSITEEQYESVMRAKRISQKKINKNPKSISSSMNRTNISKIKSFFTTQSFSNQEESFNIFKQSINETINEDQLNQSIHSQYLDGSEIQGTNIQEMRLFEIKKQSSSLGKKKSILNKSNLQETCVKKIQDCWRRYRTHKIVNQYLRSQIQRNLITEQFQSIDGFDLDLLSSKNKQITSNKIDINQDSNLFQSERQQSLNQSQESLIRQMQLHEGKKWAQIPQLVQAYLSKNSSQADTKSLLQKIATISERNKQELIKNVGTLSNESLIHSEKSSKASQFDQICSSNIRKYDHLISQQAINNFVKCRKNLLKQRKKAQSEILQQKLITSKISSQEYQKNRQLLSEWILEEQDDIQTTKRYLQIGYKRVKESIRKIQLDYSKILKMKGLPLRNCCYSTDSLLKLKYGTKITKRKSKNSYNLGLQYYKQGQTGHFSVQNSLKETFEIKRKLQSMQSQKSDVSLISEVSSRPMLRRESNTPLHKVGNVFYSQEDDDSSIDLDEFADITIQIQIKNWMDRFSNKDQVKQKIISSIIEKQILDVCKQLRHYEMDTLLYEEKVQESEEEKGIQTDIQTIKYFILKLKDFLKRNQLLVQYISKTIQQQTNTQDDYFDQLFSSIWAQIKPQLQFRQEEENDQQFLHQIVQHHYRSILDSFNELLWDELQKFKVKQNQLQVCDTLLINKLTRCLDYATERLFSNCNLLCGLYKRSIPITDEDLEFIRTERLDKMVILQILDSKPENFSVFSMRQIKNQIGKVLFFELIEQATLQLSKFV